MQGNWMMKPQSKLLTALLLLALPTFSQAQDHLQLAPDEVVVLMGGTNMVRLQQAGHFESILTQSFALSRPKFRDLAWEADTVFRQAVDGRFDAVVACYHDQGLIPVKLVSFGEAVNVTLGLPIIRTSVDHGTAFDIAGQGVADTSSLVHAVLLAARLAGSRERRSRRLPRVKTQSES